jgi:putative nucleotidyltransferase with HDIG domain
VGIQPGSDRPLKLLGLPLDLLQGTIPAPVECRRLDPRGAATLASFERRLEELPMLPAVVARLLALDHHSDSFFEEVLRLTEEDPPFTLRILRLANSAAYAPAQPVTRVRQAVALFGAERIASLATSMAVLKLIVPATRGDRYLWSHAIEVACAAREIAFLARDREIEPEYAYLCGLLHDIGRFILLQELPEKLKAVDESRWESFGALVEAERRICGFDHAELGWRACCHWGIPEAISNVVREHHHYVPDRSRDRATQRILTFVQLADRLSMRNLRTPEFWKGSWDEKEEAAAECFHPAWASRPVSAAALAARLPKVFTESRTLIEGLGLGQGHQNG